MKSGRMLLHGAALLITWVGLTSPVHGKCAIPVGDPIPNFSLPFFQGAGARPYVGNARANAMFFLRPDQEHSIEVAKKFALILEPQFAGKPVDLVAIVSDRAEPAAVQSFIAQTGIKMPVLVDTNDGAVGTLGIILHPTAVISDGQGRLVTYQPFTEINFVDVIKGYLRFELGEITESELKEIIAPTQQEQNERRVKAERRHGFARALYKKNKLEMALKEALTCIDLDPTFAPGHSMTGLIYAALGDCQKAMPEFDLALRIDPRDADALYGQTQCRR